MDARTLARGASRDALSALLTTAAAGGEAARPAAALLDAAVAGATVADLLRLDAACRSVQPWWAVTAQGVVPANAWVALQPDDVPHLRSAGLPACAFAAFHPRGHVREAAVMVLDATTRGPAGGPGILPYLLVRLNDWVAPVAERARRAVARRVDPVHAAAFARWLPLVLRLGDGTRRADAPLRDAVVALLQQPAQWSALEGGLAADDRAVRRACYGVLRDAPGGAERAVALSLGDPDVWLRRRAVADAARLLGDAALALVVARGAADPAPTVRRAVLAAAAERFAPADRGAMGCAALLDAHGGVRELARWLAARDGACGDPAALYRARVGDASTPTRALIAALGGLGEVGTAEDAALAATRLDDARPAVRRAAVRALGRLGGAAQVDLLVSALGDASPGVAWAARDALRPHARVVGRDLLARLAREAPRAHTRRAAVGVSSGLGRWAELAVLLDAAGAVDAADAAGEDARAYEVVRQRLRAWAGGWRRSFVAPDEDEARAVRGAWRARAARLDPPLRAAVRGAAAYWLALD